MADNRIAYGLAKKYGIDTTGMTPKEVWYALKEKGVTQETSQRERLENNQKKVTEAKNIYDTVEEPPDTPISGKTDKTEFVLNDEESLEAYRKITQGGGYTIKEMKTLPVFQRIQEEVEKSRAETAKRLGMLDEYEGETFRINTPEREKAREKWVNDFLSGNGVDTHPETPLRREYKLTVVVGLPASGKSSRIATPLSEEQGAFIFDSDEMKKLIDGFEGGKNADGVHKESKMLLGRAREEFTSGRMKGTNLVFPVIGDKGEKTLEKLQPFINAGYDVEIAYKKADTRQSMNRVISRAIKDGRYIPQKEVMKYNNDDIVSSYNWLLKNGIKRSKYSEI